MHQSFGGDIICKADWVIFLYLLDVCSTLTQIYITPKPNISISGISQYYALLKCRKSKAQSIFVGYF